MQPLNFGGKQMSKLDNASLLVDESLLFTGNGYLGVRANFEEGYPKGYDSIRGTYLNGFYDIVDISYGENAYGFPQTAQKMLNLPDAQGIRLYFGGEMFSLECGEIVETVRKLDIENGYAIRKHRWISQSGKEITVEFRRLTSFTRLELYVNQVTITSHNYSGEILVESTLKADVENYTNPNDPRVASGHAKLLDTIELEVNGNVMSSHSITKRSKLEVAVNVTHDFEAQFEESGQTLIARKTYNVLPGESITFTKYAAYTDSLRHKNPLSDGVKILANASSRSTEILFAEQREYLESFWKNAKVGIKGEDGVSEAVNYSIYQLLASAGKDKYSNISAKGLSGEGYEGHYFWDTEIYAIPFFTLTDMKIARNLIRFRHTILDHAREEARLLGCSKGAKIPWRTISGSECSGYFPAGTAQYHINADVAYSCIQSYLFDGNLDFLAEYGFELLVETGRLWLETGHYGTDGRFRIDDVTGPDEYTAIVNNNYYTNALAAYHMSWIDKISKELSERMPQRYNELCELLSLGQEEIKSFAMAAEKMYLPFDENLLINPQDDSFLDKAEWDFEGTPSDKYPLLLNFHPLVIYRHKVLKQADTVLAHMLLDNESDEVIANSYDYYEKRTTHDSSLSPCVYGIMASRINNPEKAYHYFMKTLKLDLKNLHHNTKDGLHIANAAGAYMAIAYGFGGLRIKPDGIHLRPTKPHHWDSISFGFALGSASVRVSISYELEIYSDKPVEIFVDSKKYMVDGTIRVPYKGKH